MNFFLYGKIPFNPSVLEIPLVPVSAYLLDTIDHVLTDTAGEPLFDTGD